MMFVRLVMPEDEDAIVEMARYNITETRPDMEFDEARCRATIHSAISDAAPSMWVVEEKREPIAFLLADMYEYRAAKGLFVTQEVLFVRSDKRGSRAAILLMKHLVSWATALGAKEIVGGNDNEYNSDRTAAFLGHFGFKKVGYAMRRSLTDGQ
jgi:L-amino acid N-acyltransferase YncA